MKELVFLGSSLDDVRDFPEEVRQEAGFQLDLVQRGEQPFDFKPMPIVGRGVEEIRLRDKDGIYRVIYTARFMDVIYVLHAFQKKTQATSEKDIALAKQRLATIGRRK